MGTARNTDVDPDAEKPRTALEKAYIREITTAFSDPDVEEEQRRMAEMIAVATDVTELPW